MASDRTRIFRAPFIRRNTRVRYCALRGLRGLEAGSAASDGAGPETGPGGGHRRGAFLFQGIENLLGYHGSGSGFKSPYFTLVETTDVLLAKLGSLASPVMLALQVSAPQSLGFTLTTNCF